MEPYEKSKGTMLKTVPQKDKDGKYASEKKDKRSKKKSKKQSTDVSKNIDVKYRDNEKSRANSRNNSQAGNRDIKAPECSLTLAKSETAWDPAGNAAVSLFPNVDSIVMSEEEMIERAIKESMETAFLEKCAMDITHNEAAEKSAAQPEIEAEWGQVQRNLPTPEPEKVSEVSDRNNNSGLHPIENLTVPGDKLQRRRWNKGQEKEDKNCGRRSETQSRNEVPMAIETPLVPTVVPKFVDKYGRIDGCNEKRLFMGKGARFKEQEYIRQLQLQEQQLTDPNLFTETQVSSSNSSTKSSNPPNALTQVSAQSKQTGDTNSRASFQKSNETPTDLLDQACGYSHDHTENTQEFNSKLENNSQYSRRSVDQFLSKMEEISNTSQYPAESAIVSADLSSEQFALPKQEFTTVSSEELPDRSQNSMQPLMENLNKLEIDGNSFKNNYDPPTMQSWTGSQELVDSSEAFSSQKLKQSTDLPKETRDSEINQISYNSEETSRQIKKEQTPIQSHLDSGSQTKTIVNISDETSGRMKQNSYISEQIPTESNQNFAPPGRPIVSGANYNNYQQKRHQSSGISVNRGGYHNGNSGDRNYNKNVRESQGEYDRGSRSEQNSSRTYGRGYNSSGYGGPKGDRNFYGPRGEPKRDFYKNARYEQNPHKYVQHNNVYQKDQRDNYQSSQKSSGGPNRDFQKGPRIDKTSHKFDDENREFNGESRGDRNFYKPDGEQKRDTNKSQTVDTNSFKSAGESIKKENNNEYLAHSQIDKKPPVSRQDLNINAPVFQIGPHSWSADVPDSQETFENAVQDVKSDTKDFNEISSNISEIPDISNFASRFSVPPPVHDFTKEMISVPPVVPPPTNHFSVTQVPHYPEINDAACSKENLPQPSSNFQAPPGFPCLERPAIPSCVCYTSGMSFEAKYASLLLKDPLLFRLLQQKQAESFNGSLKNPGIPETSGDRKVYGSCPNCSCNSQSPRNFNETTNVNVKTCQTEEERAKFELWQRMNSQPVNALNLRYPIAVQHPEALQMSHVENTEWNAGNMRNSNIPLHENPQLLPCYVDPAGNTFPLNYPLPQSYQHVQRPINLPRGEECQGFFVPGFENLPLDVQRLMHQRMMAQLYENPSGYSVIGAHYNEQIQPTMARHNQQISQIPVPFPPHKYEADIAAINRSNVVQDRLDDYHQAEYHQPPRSPGVEYNNQKANEETVQVFPSDIGVGRMKTLLSIPNKGRGRARLPQNN